jgi:hypothetical protein
LFKVELTLSDSAIAIAPSSQIKLPSKFRLLKVELILSASAIAMAPSFPIELCPSLSCSKLS